MLYYNYVIILRGIYCIIKQNDIIHKKKKKLTYSIKSLPTNEFLFQLQTILYNDL